LFPLFISGHLAEPNIILIKFFDFKGVRNCLIYSLFDHFKLGRSLVTGVLILDGGAKRGQDGIHCSGGRVQWLLWPLGWVPSYSFLFIWELHSLLFTRLLHRVLQGACLLGGYMAMALYISLAPLGCGHSTHQNSPLLFTCCLVVPYTWNETLIACRQRSPDLHEHAMPFTASEVLYKTTCSKLVFLFTLHTCMGAKKRGGGVYCVCSHLQC
jgi:hypothetical protein